MGDRGRRPRRGAASTAVRKVDFAVAAVVVAATAAAMSVLPALDDDKPECCRRHLVRSLRSTLIGSTGPPSSGTGPSRWTPKSRWCARSTSAAYWTKSTPPQTFRLPRPWPRQASPGRRRAAASSSPAIPGRHPQARTTPTSPPLRRRVESAHPDGHTATARSRCRSGRSAPAPWASNRPLAPRLVPRPLWVLFSELPVESRARNPPPQPLEHHAGHRRRGRRQQYVSHEFLCHVRPLLSAREMTRRHRRCVAGQ